MDTTIAPQNNTNISVGTPFGFDLNTTIRYPENATLNDTGDVLVTDPPINYTLGCISEIGIQGYNDLFVFSQYFSFFGVTLPILVALGVSGDIAVFVILRHREMRGLCTLFLDAILLSDVLYLLCAVLLYTPKAFVANYYSMEDCANTNPDFWASLDYAQRIFVGVFPVSELAQSLVVWFTTTLIFEQYCVLQHPQWGTKWSATETGMKIVVITINILVLAHLIHFFKLVRRDVLYSKVPHKKICLSEIYRSESYRTYDMYIYYYLVLVGPWFVALYVFSGILAVLLRRSREEKAIQRSLPDKGLIRVFKGGRSRRTIVCIGFVFLASHIMSNIAFSATLRPQETGLERLQDECYLIPVDKKFAKAHNGEILEMIFTLGLVVYSSSKFFICYAFGSEFRDLVNGLVRRQWGKVRRRCQVVKELDWRRPADSEVKEARPPRPRERVSALSVVMVQDAPHINTGSYI